jgi:PAS domain S-box-containing protein
MTLHPGAQERHFPAQAPVSWDPIRRDLEENQDWYRDLVEHSQDLLCVHDLDGRILSINPVPARLLGYSAEEMLRKRLRDVIDPRFLAEHDVYLREIKETGQSSGLVAVTTRSGQQRIWEYHNTLRTEGVSVPIVRAIAHDVTERVRAERALRKINAQLVTTAREQELLLTGLSLFRTLLDQSNDAIEVVDPATLRFLDVNEKACAELGYSREELLSLTVFDIDPQLDAGLREFMVQHLRSVGSAIKESMHRHKDGTTFPVEISLRIVRLDKEYVVAVSRDITERKRAEKTLRESEFLFRTVYERSPIGICLVDSTTGKFLEVNSKFCEITGRTQAELLQSNVASTTHPDDVTHSINPMSQLAEEKLASYEIEKRYLRPDGSIRWAKLLVVPMWTQGESRRWHMSLAEDITERKHTEEAIATLVQQVQADSSEHFFNSMAIQLAKCLDADYTIIAELVEGEPESVRTLGVCGQGVIADNFTRELADTPCGVVVAEGVCSYSSGVTDAFPKDALLKQMKIEGYAGTPLRDSQGRTLGIMVALYCHTLANAKFAEMILQLFSAGTAANIERKRTEEALRQSEERFRVALKNSPIAVFTQDQDLRYTWAYNSQLPWPVCDKLGKTPAQIFIPEEAARITEVRRRVLDTCIGERHEVQVTVGGKKLYLDTTIEPLRNAEGKVIGLTGASSDITELREISEALREAKKKLTEEKLYLEQEIDTELGFGEIIGQSKALLSVMEQVGKVARSDATVLLLGETGTGKELVARAIHRLSRRANSSFIKMNCAAIPSGLLESELFGNEKGAFTGAVSKKIGRLELADKGTLFLDEIGEISLALQPKLLRVLQDQEFERLGGTHTLKVDFRLIAATNRDLADGVREGEFRSDLFYRLNVFPVRVPPLRERREDIRLLVEYFVQKCARRMNKSIMSIPKKTLAALMEWEWPGNVRELENFVERSVILTQGSVLVSPLSELEPAPLASDGANETLEATEREHIIRALRDSHGQIGGPRGAATRLGLKRTTLQSKLKNLGINPRSLPER